MREVVEFQHTGDRRSSQGFYVLPDRQSLRPNTTFVSGDRILFETNSYGLKGPEPDPARKVMVIWGDSVIFGLDPDWVSSLSSVLTSHTALNGGMEGDPVENIVRRAQVANGRLAIDANVFFPGWHPSSDGVPVNTTFREVLEHAVHELPNIVLVTVPTSLRPTILNDTFETVLASPCPYGSYVLWGGIDQTVEVARGVLAGVQERNDIIRAVADGGDVPLFDWAAAMGAMRSDDFRQHFWDPGHPRNSAYPLITVQYANALRRLVRAELDAGELRNLG